ncbi:flagella assembly protein FlgT middle domain-containing protein [Chitiniphilus shinanonensis]|uniref:flagella assembly protein FlgT middle domain-containing protein n=1 Tax=Chitiniphilus shinanonensis TaxID=553088 RepID=UPI00036C6422|nr:flagella assembly protein FlgT middle domain-containing protein [Chitiniphilus shinanonensis]
MKPHFRLSLGAVLLAALPVLAEPVIGVAPLSAGGDARQQALDDALANASMANGVQVYAIDQSDSGRLAQSGQLRSGGLPTSYRILREWQGNGLYHIEIDPSFAPPPKPVAAAAPAQPVATAAVSAAPMAAPASSPQVQVAQGCNDPYKRKVLVTPFSVRQPSQVSDIGQFQIGLQDALTNRLSQLGLFSQRGANDIPFTVDPGLSDLRQQPDHVRRMARRQGVQFVVSGVVNDTRAEGERYTYSLGANDVKQGERKASLAIPLIDFFVPGIKAVPKLRRFDVELLLFDGVSGALIERRRFDASTGGSVTFATDDQFGSGSFYATDYGALVARQVDAMAKTALEQLSCLPFSTRVVRVERGQAYLDAGSLSGLMPGDRLQRYRLKPGALPVDGLVEGDMLRMGQPEELAGTLTIVQVQPLFSIAVADQGVPEAGDYARSGGKARPARR